MYRAFYHLHTDPFRVGSDPALCFRHEPYARALACVQDAVRRGEGFVILTGPAGSGKTALIEDFYSRLDGAESPVARLTGTGLQGDELLRLVCLSLGVSIAAAEPASILQQLRQFFVQQAQAGRRNLLLIGAAQDLPVEALEELCLLGNLQLNERPLLQIVLVGQPQLLDRMRLPALMPLLQNKTVTCHLQPLSSDETRAYIVERLSRAGWIGDPAFDECSYRMIHHFSEGLPRQINKVCERLLLYGSVEKKHSLNCFDSLKVVRQLLGERLGATRKKSLQACVDMLNAAWRSAESGAAVDAVAAQSMSLAAEQQPPFSDPSAVAQPSPDAVPPPAADDRQAVPVEAQAGSTRERESSSPAADQPQRAAGDAGQAVTEPRPGVQSGSDAGSAAESVLPVSVAPFKAESGRRTGPPRESLTRPERSRKRTAARAAAALGLLAALLGALLFVSREQNGGGPGNLAGPPVAPQVAGPGLAVARLVPRSPPTLPDSTTVPLSASAVGGADREVAVPVEDRSEAQPEGQQTGPAELAPAALSAEQVSTAVPGHDDSADQQLRADRPVSLQTPEDSPAASAPLPQQTPTAAVAAGDSPETAVDRAPELTPRPALPGLKPDTAAQVVAAPGAVPASSGEQRIEQLLARAEQALAEYRLTTPMDDSAYRYYRRVLEIAPQHRAARIGMERIAERYAWLTERALAADEIDVASRYITRGLSVSPGNRELLGLQHQLQAREVWPEVAAEEAEAARTQAEPPKTEQAPQRVPDNSEDVFQ